MGRLHQILAVGLMSLPAALAIRVLRRGIRSGAGRRLRSGFPSATESSPTTLDPAGAADWDALRASAHKLLDASIDRMQSAKEGRVWTPVPEDMRASLRAPVPTDGVPHDALGARLEQFLPYGVGNTHPRFFGWVHGSGAPGSVLPELVGAAMNANCGGRDHAAIHIEKQVLSWARQIMGFPADAGALLVSGTSMATIVALKSARDRYLGFEASRVHGLATAQSALPCGGNLVGYMADGAHSCIKRAFDVLGLGSVALRGIPTTDAFTMDVGALRAAIAADRAAGYQPFVVIGTAGSVNVGAIDDLNAIADVTAEERVWFHVDGAFGAAGMLSDEVRPRLAGIERADSLAFDFHKWLHVNYDCGCVLVRDGDAHLRAFSERPDYLAPATRGLAAGGHWPVDFGPELSRTNRALKVWSHLTEHGTTKLGKAIGANVAHASHLAKLVDAEPALERLAPADLNIVVFRYVGAGGATRAAAGGIDLDALNDALVVELQERGVAAPSTTRIRGALCVRVNITNHRTRFEDLELLVAEVRRIGAEIIDELTKSAAEVSVKSRPSL